MSDVLALEVRHLLDAGRDLLPDVQLPHIEVLAAVGIVGRVADAECADGGSYHALQLGFPPERRARSADAAFKEARLAED